MTSKLALHFGAGKIGRGFIGQLLHNSGYKIIFADIIDNLVEQINKDKKYKLYLLEHNHQLNVIDNVAAYSSIKNPEKIIEAIKDAEIITTSVMATNLDKVAPLLAKGLNKRTSKVIIMACENAILATNILKQALLDTNTITKEHLDEVAIFANTAVDRIVFDYKDGVEIADAYELAVEDVLLNHPIIGAEYVDNILKFLQRKIYIVNCGHALSAYFGFLKGYQTVQEALADNEIQTNVRYAVKQSAAALEKEYGFSKTDLSNYIENMMIKRFTAPGLADSIHRVAREPIRKISPEDRIMGPANLCIKHNLPNDYLLQGVACALKYKNPEDAQAVELQNSINNDSLDSTIVKYAGVEINSPAHNKIKEFYSKQLFV